MKGFMKKTRTAIVLFVVAALIAPFFMGQGANAASAKKYTVGAFQVAAPATWQATQNTIGNNEQLTFQNGMYVLLVQSTYVGQTIDNKYLKSALKLGFDAMSQSMGCKIKGAKYGETNIKLGKAVKFTGKFIVNGISMKCRGYAVSKNGYMMLAMAVGNQDKNEKKVINSIKLK